jgi:hypothetical protein
MELREFLKVSLREIIEAMEDVAIFAKQHGAEINPSTLEWRTDQGQVLIYDSESELLATLIEYDVAVTSERGNEQGVGAGIKVLGIGMGANADARYSAQNQSVSRIKFSVPVVLPTSKPKRNSPRGAD